MRLPLAALSATLPLTLLFARDARAVENEHHVGAGGGLSMLKIDDKSTLDVGAGFGLHYAYGLSDAFNLMVEGSHNIVALGERPIDSKTPHTRPATLSSLGAGLGYVLDILQIVPYGGILAAGYYMQGGTIDSGKFLGGIQLALGVDYRVSRRLAVGVAGRQHMLLTDFSTYPTFTTVFARFEYTWGW